MPAPWYSVLQLTVSFFKKKLPHGTDALKRLKSGDPPETVGGNKRIIIKKKISVYVFIRKMLKT